MFSRIYKRYVLSMLTVVFTLNYLDRNLMALLLQPIKEDLRLTDTQLGLLTGIAFGLFYATLGLPIARWADRGDRTTIAAASIGLWGATVMSCVFVTNFASLLFARVAAAVGEAGCMPPTSSMIGDYFPAPTERIRAMTVYWLAAPLSSLVSFVVGGWLNEHFGWRITFFVIGTPALLVAVLLKLTVVEPRMYAHRAPIGERQSFKLVDVVRTLWRQQSLRHLTIAYTLLLTMALGLGPWYAAFMIRSHDMNTTDVGVYLGLIFGLGGVAGILLGGYVAGRWFAQDERSQMHLSAAAIASVVPCFVLFLLLPQKQEALVALVPLVVVFSVFLGPTFALMQRLIVDEMRARSLAIVMFLANLIGLGFGPLAVGMLSDLLNPYLGSDSLRYAMLSMSSVAFWSAYHFWRVGRTVRNDLLAVVDLGTRAPAPAS